jgi:RNA polymerase sigma factor (sigma-70 family)
VSTEGVATAEQGATLAVVRDQSEIALVLRARAGDHDAFGELVDLRLNATFRSVMAILGNESDARDVTQTIFVQAWTNLPSLRDPALFPAWFGRIVVNAARTALRGRRRRSVREIQASELPDDRAAMPADETKHEDRAADLDRLERALERISAAERTVLWLHHYEGLSLADIGSRLGVRSGTVKSRLFTARRALERELQVEDR